jgi:hypothetical protein
MKGMKVRDFFLATHTEVRDSLGFITGAFPEWWTVPGIPATTRMDFMVVFDYTEDLNEVGHFHIDHHAPDADVRIVSIQASRGATPRDAAGGPRYQPFAFEAELTFNKVGLHEFVLSQQRVSSTEGGFASEVEIERVSLWVQLPPEHTAFDQARADDSVSR